jgi:hypothetical protein
MHQKEIKRNERMEATQEQLEFLDELRESGECNMFGAGPYLMDEFGLNKREASAVLIDWMGSFSKRHGHDE